MTAGVWGWRRDRLAVVGLALAVATVSCLVPLVHLVVTSAGEAVAGSGALLLDARQRGLLFTTAILGAGTAAGAVIIGLPLGLALARVAMPIKPVLRVALAAPVALPPYVVALAWTYVGGSRGLAAALLGRDVLSDWTYGLPAAVLVLSLVYYPIPMLATEATLRRIDGRLEEAGLLVGSPWLVLRRISLPLAAPYVTAATLVVFVLAVSDFGAPSLLRVRVYTTEVFTAFSTLYDFSRAVVLTVPLVVLAMLAALPAGLLAGGLVSTRRSTGRAPIRLDGWRAPAQLWAMLVLAAALVVPVAVLLREASFARDPAAIVRGSGAAVAFSLVLAAAGATAVLAVSLWLGHAVVRLGERAARAAAVVCVALFAIPSTVIGVSLIGFWNRPGLLGAVYGTNLMLLLGYLARFLPIAVLVTAAAARAVPGSHEEAAAIGGASWLRTMGRVVVPQMRLGLAVAWTLVFILVFGELGVSLLVAPPGDTTLPIRIYTMIANAPSAHIALLALLQALVILVPLAVVAVAAAAWERA